MWQVTHTEQNMPAVSFPGKQGIVHAVDNGFLISSTTQSNGLRGGSWRVLSGAQKVAVSLGKMTSSEPGGVLPDKTNVQLV